MYRSLGGSSGDQGVFHCYLTADQANKYICLDENRAIALASVGDPNQTESSLGTLLFLAGFTFAGLPATLNLAKEVEP
jgi:hypothetical protein